MRLAIMALAAVFLGLVGGGVSALTLSGLLTQSVRLGETVEIDGWRSNWSIGTEAVDPYTKAWVARFGLFALRREEAVYFFTTLDEQGQPLREECRYSLNIGDQPGTWWSVTVYDSAGYLPKNGDDRLSFDAFRAEASDTRRVVLSARDPQDDSGYWVSTRNAGTFDVTLRVYQPRPEAIANPNQHFSPPMIERQSCDGGAGS